jgi:fumarate reductase subunit D
MKCPHCEYLFPLTWRRYLTAPLGVHRCPQCQQKSKLNHTAAYYTALLATLIVLVVGLAFPVIYFEKSLTEFYLSDYHWLGIYGAVLLFVILDKLFDNHLRILEKMENNTSQVSS